MPYKVIVPTRTLPNVQSPPSSVSLSPHPTGDASDHTDLPGLSPVTGGDQPVTAMPPLAHPPCPSCRGARAWRSFHGPIICARCHPPADPNLVAEWLGLQPAPLQEVAK